MIIYRFFYALLFFSAWFLKAFNAKIKKGFHMRQRIEGTFPWLNFERQQKPIWFHCSSGEFEYAKPVITQLKSQNPNSKILVTYFSPTYAQNIQSFPGVDMACPLPWDFVGAVRDFIKFHRPQKLLIARTDLWPEVLYQCKVLGVQSYLFSATCTKPKSLWLRWIYKMLTKIFCVSLEDQKNFNLSGLKAEALGDTRYDQVIKRLQKTKSLKNNLQPPGKVFIAGSTWPEDEKVLLPVIAKLITQHYSVLLVPHEPEPEHVQSLQKQLRELNLEADLYSQAKAPSPIMIVDQVGILAELYTWSKLAFVGGSFKGSVHSVMEALATGQVVFVGPHYQNNREAVEFSKIPVGEIHAVNCFTTSEQFFTLLDKLPHENSIREIVLQKTGATEKLLKHINNGEQNLSHNNHRIRI